MPEKKYDKYTIEMSLSARRDLAEITRYIAQNNPRTALRVTDRIEAKINSLDHFPHKGSYVPELMAKNKDYRQITEPPWEIIYRVDNEVVTIMAVVDSRRNLQDILTQKLMK